MAGLYNDGDALWLEHFGEGKADLLCEPFLDLKSPRKHFDYSSNLGEANYSAVGDVPDVHLALLARPGTGSLIIPSQRMARGGARKAKRTQCLSRLPSHRGLRETRRRSRWCAGSLRSPL
jgi:hypothetical protein